MHSEYKLSLPSQTPEGADPAVRPMLAAAKEKLGFVPNMYANMPNGPGVLETYIHGYDHFRTMVATRGLPTRKDVVGFLAAGYTERHVLGVILAVSVKTLSNCSNHLFHTPVDQVFAARAWNAPSSAK